MTLKKINKINILKIPLYMLFMMMNRLSIPNFIKIYHSEVSYFSIRRKIVIFKIWKKRHRHAFRIDQYLWTRWSDWKNFCTMRFSSKFGALAINFMLICWDLPLYLRRVEWVMCYQKITKIKYFIESFFHKSINSKWLSPPY